jgi:hypothetical protein
MERVEWVRGNALEPRTYQHLLPGAVGAISCVGGFGNTQQMIQVRTAWAKRTRPPALTAGTSPGLRRVSDAPRVEGGLTVAGTEALPEAGALEAAEKGDWAAASAGRA